MILCRSSELCTIESIVSDAVERYQAAERIEVNSTGTDSVRGDRHDDTSQGLRWQLLLACIDSDDCGVTSLSHLLLGVTQRRDS